MQLLLNTQLGQCGVAAGKCEFWTSGQTKNPYLRWTTELQIFTSPCCSIQRCFNVPLLKKKPTQECSQPNPFGYTQVCVVQRTRQTKKASPTKKNVKSKKNKMTITPTHLLLEIHSRAWWVLLSAGNLWLHINQTFHTRAGLPSPLISASCRFLEFCWISLFISSNSVCSLWWCLFRFSTCCTITSVARLMRASYGNKGRGRGWLRQGSKQSRRKPKTGFLTQELVFKLPLSLQNCSCRTSPGCWNSENSCSNSNKSLVMCLIVIRTNNIAQSSPYMLSQ